MKRLITIFLVSFLSILTVQPAVAAPAPTELFSAKNVTGFPVISAVSKDGKTGYGYSENRLTGIRDLVSVNLETGEMKVMVKGRQPTGSDALPVGSVYREFYLNRVRISPDSRYLLYGISIGVNTVTIQGSGGVSEHKVDMGLTSDLWYRYDLLTKKILFMNDALSAHYLGDVHFAVTSDRFIYDKLIRMKFQTSHGYEMGFTSKTFVRTLGSKKVDSLGFIGIMRGASQNARFVGLNVQNSWALMDLKTLKFNEVKGLEKYRDMTPSNDGKTLLIKREGTKAADQWFLRAKTGTTVNLVAQGHLGEAYLDESHHRVLVSTKPSYQSVSYLGSAVTSQPILRKSCEYGVYSDSSNPACVDGYVKPTLVIKEVGKCVSPTAKNPDYRVEVKLDVQGGNFASYEMDPAFQVVTFLNGVAQIYSEQVIFGFMNNAAGEMVSEDLSADITLPSNPCPTNN